MFDSRNWNEELNDLYERFFCIIHQKKGDAME